MKQSGLSGYGSAPLLLVCPKQRLRRDEWGLDYGNANVAYRADDGGNRPLAGGWLGCGESSF
jgi:hypothetical protein